MQEDLWGEGGVENDKVRIKSIAQDLRSLLTRIDDIPPTTSKSEYRRLRAELEAAASDLQARLTALDPTRLPTSFFDPADPRLFGTFAAVALVGQPRVSMRSLSSNRFYGSGVYAIYYTGTFDAYIPVSGTENPIYVGKADPALSAARTPLQQGTRLHGRLEDHRKNIDRATNLDLDDFECRFLPIASGWQGAAESALIALFKPLWNKETNVLLGFGKHGDSATTRLNKRSPWDVMHPGRGWAVSEVLADSKSPEQIAQEVAAHFSENIPIRSFEEVIHILMGHVADV